MLHTVLLFRDMQSADLAALEAASTILEPRDRGTVFDQGDPADAVYAVIGGDGHVRVGAVDQHSKALMVELLRLGDVFGEIGVIDGGTRTASAVVEGRVRLVRIRSQAFLEALATSPALGNALCRLMARRLRRTYGLFQDATFETLEVRLARQVLYLLDQDSKPTPQGVRIGSRLRQKDLADLLGTTTRSIITILNTWRSAGLVAYDTDRALLTARDVPALRAIIDR
ncbi:MAG TPA: Crp/Fnr family transcriptional regulator [Rhodopila sp.]|nr:Crp/Fnr family transcriptional regulator [Rhodopila sp.]